MVNEADAIVAEVEQFLAAYQDDLVAHARTALADRYHRDGVFMQFQGRTKLYPYPDIRQLYLEQWPGPASFVRYSCSKPRR